MPWTLVPAASAGTMPPTSMTSMTRVPRSGRDPKGLYERLGIPSTASDDEVRSAALARLAETHPDHGGDPKEFMQTLEAYRVLTRERASYDASTETDASEVKVRFTMPVATSRCAGHQDYIWYKEPGSMLEGDDVERLDSWLRLVMQVAHEFAYQGPIGVGMVEECPHGFGVYDDIAVMARGQEPSRWAAETYILYERSRRC